MTTLSVRAIGFCAHYSEDGERAFQLAFSLAKKRRRQLNIFQFLHDPYEPAPDSHGKAAGSERQRRLVEMERSLRLYYDAWLGDYVDVGFRVCEESAWKELQRCLLLRREFQTLVLACPREDARFGERPLLEYVDELACPTIVVGPGSRPHRFNAPARLILDQLFEEDMVSGLQEIGNHTPQDESRRSRVEPVFQG
jgi:hypothetical protein